ncbi:hypothetical protein HOLleu_06428 [Holothuria leucospilota]|uniref:Tyrosine-protein kinase ephrin type A/B receptor-like domain-containing protein n=1 Tax=Holothuria leucospilota TaxID=206669 RepID=A0A9Q1CLG8_HOLLE|nr:hypothetical protein HOLleu_06428 [Holothuria leucospilota]
MSCIGPNFVPKFSLSSKDNTEDYISRILGVEGFACTLNNVTNYHSCKLCPQGTYSNGLNECIPCPKGGFYQDEIGSYSNIPGQLVCKKCAKGTYVNRTRGTSQKDCIFCPDGTNKSIHAGFRACFCKNEFARRGRFDKCFHCKQQGLKCSGQDFESLKPGYFWDWNFPNASIDEYNMFVANLLNETRFYDNRTIYSKRIPRVHKCPRTASCINNFSEEGSVETTCALGYTGWLCNICLPGYYSVYSCCLRCPNVNVLVLGLFLILCVGLVVLYFFWLSYNKQREEGKQRNTVDIIVSRVKIMLGFYQVTGQYLSSFNNVNLEGTMQIIAEMITALEINMMKLFVRPQCFDERLVINPKGKFIIAMAALFAFTAIPCLLYKIFKVYFKIRYQAENFSDRISNLKAVTLYFVVVILFITYPATCTSIFQIFPGSCQSFCLDLENQYCFTALRSDYDVRCDKQLIVYQVLAVMATVGYVVVFPLVLFYMLKKHCSAPVSRESEERNRTTAKHETTAHLSTSSRRRHLPQYLKFLCENYKSNYWYWEIVELARKVTQTFLITMLGWDNKFTVLLTVEISVLFLTLHARYRPMKSVREQRLQVMFSLVAILANVVFIAVEMPNKYKDVFSGFLIFLNISLILFVTLEALLVAIFQLKLVLLQWTSKGLTRFATQRIEKTE